MSSPDVPPAEASMSEQRIGELAERFVATFAHLAPAVARVSVTLVRLLGEGSAVRWDQLAAATGREDAELQALVRGWPGVYEEPAGLTGFGGLSIRAVSKHRLLVGSRTLFGRCAWDTLVLPGLLRSPAQVHSACGRTGAPVHLSVTPRGVTRLVPAGTRVSLLEPQPAMAHDLTALF